MADPRVPLKNPILAVCLGLIMPGAGQLYQGRTFKGVLYAICILGTFTYGMFLSEWTALYAGNPEAKKPFSALRRWGYLAQIPIGLPAFLAVPQQQRYGADSNVPQVGLTEPILAPFRGVVQFADYQNAENHPGITLDEAMKEANRQLYEAWAKAIQEGRELGEIEVQEGNFDNLDFKYLSISGAIDLEPISTYLGPAVRGRFVGHVMNYNPETNQFDIQGDPIELPLNSVVGRFEIERPIYADPDRALRIDVVSEGDSERPQKVGELRGTIPRPVTDWLAVPLEQERIGRLHFKLGKTYDLALVYTWVASLLNVLVLWDAFEGPAYGYGDEKPEDDDSDSSKKSQPEPNPDTASASTEASPATSPA